MAPGELPDLKIDDLQLNGTLRAGSERHARGIRSESCHHVKVWKRVGNIRRGSSGQQHCSLSDAGAVQDTGIRDTDPRRGQMSRHPATAGRDHAVVPSGTRTPAAARHHATPPAARAEPGALARERHQPLRAAASTTEPGEATGEPAAAEEVAELPPPPRLRRAAEALRAKVASSTNAGRPSPSRSRPASARKVSHCS